MSKLALGLLTLTLIGAGCQVPQLPRQTSAEERGANAEALNLSSGSELVIRGTVLGFGGGISEDLGSNVGRRMVTVEAYAPGSSADLSWTLRVRRETETSIQAREQYNEEVQGISDDAPEPPQREYEEVDVMGSLATNSLEVAKTIYLPAYWGEGDRGVIEDNSILWLSREKYDELVETRVSSLSVGLFDNVLRPLELADNISNALNRLKGEAEEVSRYKDLYKLEASPEFGSAGVTVSGERKEVRTIQASNWFGAYSILANRDNPLILKVTLNPLSLGAISIISPLGILESFLGYEVVEIKHD